jgi:hypothetical protein
VPESRSSMLYGGRRPNNYPAGNERRVKYFDLMSG